MVNFNLMVLKKGTFLSSDTRNTNCINYKLFDFTIPVITQCLICALYITAVKNYHYFVIY